MSKAQKGNNENKKPKEDKNQSKANMSAYKTARASRPAAHSRKRPDARFGLRQTAYNNAARADALFHLRHARRGLGRLALRHNALSRTEPGLADRADLCRRGDFAAARIGRSRMSKIKEVMLLALVADGSIEMKIADAGKVVNTIYDALKANGLLVASGKKKKKQKSK